ncbi:hypothetical protein [Dyadobacter luticola]|uniref:Uncharacterized protein n=1 Tax=Dyadobacter luticola TaxID=1979387 RepID=A0A5R9L3X2_9BACT|nr:hypothetical protein [Dyadobacter luticola]TLV03108.1 hypothetical protein FEN17_05715 [Dyadobacter luticola]
MPENSEKRKELEEKILSKRQQIEFERTDMDNTFEFAAENRENPDVMEESKNYDDPPENVIDSEEVKSLKMAEKELQDLLDQLEALNKS